MKITLKDGSVKEYEQSMTILDIARDLSEGLARVACAGEVDGSVEDLRTVIDKDCSLNILTANDPEGLKVIRHTASHILAEERNMADVVLDLLENDEKLKNYQRAAADRARKFTFESYVEQFLKLGDTEHA